MRVLITLALLAASFTARAGFITGNQLKEYLDADAAMARGEQSANPYKAGIASGYIAGVFDFGNEIMFCPSSGVTRGQIAAVISRHLEQHPEQWNSPAVELIVDALKMAFPCKK